MLDGHEPKQVALYARVSTKESTERQNVENQLRELRDFCTKQDWEVIAEYIDHESGAKTDREQFQLLFVHAHQRKFDAVVFWALDRFSREGSRETLTWTPPVCQVKSSTNGIDCSLTSGLLMEPAFLATMDFAGKHPI